MREFKRFALFLTAIGVMATIFVVVILVTSTSLKQERKKLNWEELPLVALEGVTLTHWNELGDKVWLLQAGSALQYADVTILEHASVTLFEDAVPISSGSADSVSVNNSSSDFDLEGNITVVSYHDKATLATSQLHWDAKERKIYSDEDVMVARGDLIVRGKGLVAEPDLSQITIYNQVTSYLKGEHE